MNYDAESAEYDGLIFFVDNFSKRPFFELMNFKQFKQYKNIKNISTHQQTSKKKLNKSKIICCANLSNTILWHPHMQLKIVMNNFTCLLFA